MEIEEATAAVEMENHEMRPFAEIRAHHASFTSTMSTTSCTISYTASAKILLYGLILVTCVLLVAGGAFTSIFIEDRNVLAAVSAFFSAAISLGTLTLLIMHLLKKFEKFHDLGTLSGLKALGMIVSVLSGIALGVFTIQAFLNKQGFEFKGQNYFSAAVFSGLCLASSLELYIVAQWYQNALQKNRMITTFAVPAVPRRY